jgi:hypothetical protein
MYNRTFKIGIRACGVILAVVNVCAAQPAREGATLNFDLWCQEEARLPITRCDSRTPEDQQAFEAHRAALEHYDIPHRSARYNQGRVNRDIMNADPIDNPRKDDLGGQRQDPEMQPSGSPAGK